jgi:AcrR family transcriptional regulator
MIADPSRPRGRPPRASARAEIIGATLALLAERGVRATTMDAIAAEAGVAKNTIYRRWTSKEELVADALGELTGPQVEPDPETDVRTLLRRRAHEIVRVLADPLLGRILPDVLGELQRNQAFAVAFTNRVIRPRRQAVVDGLRRAARRGELHPEADPQLIADLLVGPPFLRLLIPYRGAASARYADELVETLWRGIAAGGRRDRARLRSGR